MVLCFEKQCDSKRGCSQVKVRLFAPHPEQQDVISTENQFIIAAS
jgi:hypothetical protein